MILKLIAVLKSSALPAGRPAQWCGAHKGPGMVDVANRRCENDNCHKVCTMSRCFPEVRHMAHLWQG